MVFYCNPSNNYEDYCRNTMNSNCTGACGNPMIFSCNCICTYLHEYPDCSNNVSMKFFGYIIGAILFCLLLGVCFKNTNLINQQSVIRRHGRLAINYVRNSPIVINRSEPIPPSYDSLPPSYQDLEANIKNN
jgi:hypothetical protein